MVISDKSNVFRASSHFERDREETLAQMLRTPRGGGRMSLLYQKLPAAKRLSNAAMMWDKILTIKEHRTICPRFLAENKNTTRIQQEYSQHFP